MISIRRYNMQLVPVLLLLISCVQAINQHCNLTSPCPTNSSCLNNGFCACDPTYIGDCNIQSLALNSTTQSLKLQQGVMQLLSINPQVVDTPLQYQLPFCLVQINGGGGVNLEFNIWIDNGTISTFNGQTAESTSNGDFQIGCVNLFIIQQVQTQPNGQPSIIVLGVTALGTASVTLSCIEGSPVPRLSWLVFLGIGLGLAATIACVVSLLSCAYSRRRRQNIRVMDSGPRRAPQNDISHFDNLMPVFEMKEEMKQPCAICLNAIQKKDMVRETPCSHFFHASCLDAWCKKTMNCPVCRVEFTIDELKAVGESPRKRMQEEERADWEEQIPTENPALEIRNSML